MIAEMIVVALIVVAISVVVLKGKSEVTNIENDVKSDVSRVEADVKKL